MKGRDSNAIELIDHGENVGGILFLLAPSKVETFFRCNIAIDAEFDDRELVGEICFIHLFKRLKVGSFEQS